MSWFKRRVWAASSLRQQLRTFSHTGSYRAMQEGSPRPDCTVPLPGPSANNSQCAFDSNPNLSHQQGLKDPATAVQGSWWRLSSAVPGDLETQWFQNMKKLLLIFDSTLEKLACQKLPPWGTGDGWHQLKRGWAIEVLSPGWDQGGPFWQPRLAGAFLAPVSCHCLLPRPLLKAHSVSLWWPSPLALL